MKIYKIAQNKTYIGYKIVGFNGKYAYSIYDTKQQVSLTLNETRSYPSGMYLGSSRDFCINYYSGGTNDRDLLLTYEFSIENLVKGDPNHPNDEMIVNKATLVNVEELENQF